MIGFLSWYKPRTPKLINHAQKLLRVSISYLVNSSRRDPVRKEKNNYLTIKFLISHFLICLKRFY